MYGIVNKAVQGLVISNFGQEKWAQILLESGVKDDTFLSNESYPDKTTFDLAIAASNVLKMNLNDVLIAFGEYWVLETGNKAYGELMKAGGNNLKEFLINLPSFHSRVMLMYPNLTPPEFKIEDSNQKTMNIHYISTRDGLTYFMYGLISGLGKMYKESISIEVINKKSDGHKNDVFRVKWI
jgi:hypothetical protein